MFDGGRFTSPSGGFSGVMGGMGMGMGMCVCSFWMKTTGKVAFCGLYVKVIEVALLWASMSRLRAGCGTPTLIRGPQ